MQNAANTPHEPTVRGLSAVYRRLYLLGKEAERARMLALGKDPAARTCPRCGGDAYVEGDNWRCWNCDFTGSSE